MGALLALGCATAGGLLPGPGSGAQGGEPWEVPDTAFPTQRLYRVKYQGPEGDAGFKLTLYLESARHYRMLASDSLGRKIWSLAIDPEDQALWLDHRRKTYCRSSGASRLRLVPLGDLPLVALPKLLLGRLPAAPVANLRRAEGRLSYLDARGQLWTAQLLDDGPEWWSLVEAGKAVVWWRREERGGVFENRREGQQVRWREIVRESLERSPARLTVPGKYRSEACGEEAGRG